MPKEERKLTTLEDFLPANTFDLVAPYFKEHQIYLTLTHDRKSVLGDYRAPYGDKHYHRISINATLNKFSFLITLLHEIAHLLTYVIHKHKVSPHGKEWKGQFRITLLPFLGKHIFPPDVERALLAYLQNPAASTCTDPHLYKALHKYDGPKPGVKFIDEIAVGEEFETENGRRFIKLEKMRTRSRCKDLKTGKMYLFSGIATVTAVINE